MTQRTVTLLGSTGSIGTQAVDVVDAFPDRFRVVAIAAGGSDLGQLARQAVHLQVEQVAVANGDDTTLAQFADALEHAARAGGRTAYRPQILSGPDAATTVAGNGADVVLNAITGSIGLRPTLAALAAGSTLALANKESLIVGGPVVKAAAAPGQIVPVDSEHSAIAQCLRGGSRQEVRKLVLTASGGPFRGMTRSQLREVTPQQALQHPTWDMGVVVTTNSATLVNKGLEVIEAHLLFDVPFDDIEVAVHPQSVVHSMVEFMDGSTLLQASPPTMTIPIALGMSWPDRLTQVAQACDWTRAATWEFLPLDEEAFPAVRLAVQVGREGGTFPAVYNAANEVAVAAFHAGQLRFTDIVDLIGEVVDEHSTAAGNGSAASGVDLTVDQVLAADTWARTTAADRIGAISMSKESTP
ncbi:MAG: 1-deoxy-D-xylulose-5-phosphate reductoisomerase [Ornithinimicrobium sp.]|uniref:1-deoxy-D-xylulose-5-phosphate reductoisomerase n=1 Tax=Ornithinimicrobium sp. TaxID=1977084 RepID=UPI0026DF9DFA|nr:1-deoxy-D-xylulose-5-phosphate reductoisomerase [Ornithinimicrobium sp.]MDO5739324.1 1-deoxy-D-xylulose-5-phosphate reductoisomerase [Ornithinimicrobium sp.]